MKYALSFVLACAVFVFAVRVDAAEIVLKPLFTVETAQIAGVAQTDKTQFVFNVGSDSRSQIAYWKVRMYCEPGVKLNLDNGTANQCGKAVDIVNPDLEQFSLFFDPSKPQISKFSFKLKAYDKNRKWLHTEEKSFSWN